MLTKISRYIFILIFILAAAVYLPEFYWKFFGKRSDFALIYYSPIIKQFVGNRVNRSNEMEYFDFQGSSYSKIEYEKLLPFMYYYDLDKWNVLPREVQGIPIDISTIRRNSQSFIFQPYHLHNPLIQLYPLFESESDFARLTLPDEVFRIGDRMEFIDVRKNVIVEQLTTVFTTALQEAGFVFPARIIAGNPTTRKPFDEGYFIVDAVGSVFHVKMVKGQPFCKKTVISPDLDVRYISISEDPRREFYGFLITASDSLYMIMYDDYKLVPLPLAGFDPDDMRLRFIADPIYRTISYSNSERVNCVVTDLKYNFIDSCHVDLVSFKKTIAGRVEKGLFPFKIETESNKSNFRSFRLVLNGYLGLLGIIPSLLLFILIKYIFGNEKVRNNPLDLLIVALTGIYGLLTVLIIKPEIWEKSANPFGY
ncbi:MAG: hypothetical protein COT43_07765 [Candidatus Marinimicrobia bacterium CG08_land_8_20_14_0_20_45_22]|nr:MAG: hypothetical protein COT43_07765 [Candidatus Marinimicrobia bacterium CG08_land_8_20_14_0_20_45_22]